MRMLRNQTNKQSPCKLLLQIISSSSARPQAFAIMSFQTSRSRAADIISVTLPAPNQAVQHFFSLSSLASFPVWFTSGKKMFQTLPSHYVAEKMLLVAFLSSAPTICWFLLPSMPSHLFSSLSMVCATFFS